LIFSLVYLGCSVYAFRELWQSADRAMASYARLVSVLMKRTEDRTTHETNELNYN